MFGLLKGRRKRKAAQKDAHDILTAFAAARSPGEGQNALARLKALASGGTLTPAENHTSFISAYVLYADASIRDDLVGTEEAEVLNAIYREIGDFTPQDVEGGEFLSANNRVLACMINAIGPVPLPSSLGGTDGTVYWTGPVQLMRQKRTFRGHSPSISVPLGKGVRFRWSTFEGAPAYSLDYVAVDAGSFAVSLNELVFLGAHNTITTKLRDVIQVELLADGFRVHSARRERVDMFRTFSAPVAVATIQWLISHHDDVG